MLRFLLGLILLPFAIYSVLVSGLIISKLINAFNQHAAEQQSLRAPPAVMRGAPHH